jgi:hypothetical protein
MERNQPRQLEGMKFRFGRRGKFKNKSIFSFSSLCLSLLDWSFDAGWLSLLKRYFFKESHRCLPNRTIDGSWRWILVCGEYLLHRQTYLMKQTFTSHPALCSLLNVYNLAPTHCSFTSSKHLNLLYSKNNKTSLIAINSVHSASPLPSKNTDYRKWRIPKNPATIRPPILVTLAARHPLLPSVHYRHLALPHHHQTPKDTPSPPPNQQMLATNPPPVTASRAKTVHRQRKSKSLAPFQGHRFRNNPTLNLGFSHPMGRVKTATMSPSHLGR